ncbi:protein of unknown function [Sinosporangium album]|uniref:DUF397 domain-containing protein n=1 Tax=Sinosporangium album TaxID=504805 RepID=A0A1G8A419_9ACTN|nr:DUF397 domain-containing protein [Sinosporangium album]SDH15702.1 protein of unknown function [Sinosporangium album]
MLSDHWHKSSLSGSTGGGCVEARWDGAAVHVRDTKQHGQGPMLMFTRGEWEAFLGGVAGGEFDLPGMTKRS